MAKFRNTKRCYKAAKRMGRNLYWGTVIRAVIESHTIGFICCLINLKAAESQSGEQDWWTAANTNLTYAVLTLFILFPVFSVIFMLKNHSRLHERLFERKYGEMYAGYSIEMKQMLVFLSF